VDARADHPGGTGELLGRSVRAVLERPGVGREQRKPVGEDVVHLAGDARTLGRARLGDAAGLLGLGPAGLLAQRFEQRVPGPRELAPADQGGLGHQHQHHPPERGQRADRPPEAADQQAHHPRARHRDGDREAPAQGHVQGRVGRGGGGRGRQRRQHRQRQRARDRPAQQHRQQREGGKAGRDVEGQQRRRDVPGRLPPQRRGGQRADPRQHGDGRRQPGRFAHLPRLGPARLRRHRPKSMSGRLRSRRGRPGGRCRAPGRRAKLRA